MKDDVCWIEVIGEDEAAGVLKDAYDDLMEKDGYVENLYRAFSRYPHAIKSADQAYRDVLHVPDAPLPMWLSEMIGVQVAVIAGCAYALANHGDNMVRLHDDQQLAGRMRAALEMRYWDHEVFSPQLRVLLEFGEKLSLQPDQMEKGDIEDLRAAGFDDEQISQIVQVAANFAYWVRVINGFGIQLGAEKIGKYS